MRLENKIALVTGGASGIGRETVMELARCGALVICADLNEQGGNEVAAEARRLNLAVDFVRVDMSDRDSVRQCAAQVLAQHSRIDILVNAAGWNDIQPFIENAPEYMERVVAINLCGPLHL